MAATAYKGWQTVAVYSLGHLIVDFACAFLMFRGIAGTAEGYLCVLLYNFCAFALQLPLGLIADKLNRNFLLAISGCLLTGLAYGLLPLPVLAVIAAGTGNALFHLGGGIDVLNISEEKLGALGVFVSPGAVGIYYGTMLGRGNGWPALVMPLALLAAAAVIFLLHKARGGAYPKNAAFSLPSPASRPMLAAAACLFLVVCLRSYTGLALNFPWKSSGHWGTALLCAVVLGKTAGGLAADHWGLRPSALASLGLAALLFLLPASPPAGVAALLLFNMSMPITLWAMAKLLPGAKGFAFGLLTFALFLGFLPVYLGLQVPAGAAWLFAPLAALSWGLLWLGLRRAKL